MVNFLPPTQKGHLPQHKGSTVRLGPASGGRAEEMAIGCTVAARGGRSAWQGPQEHPGPRRSLASLPCPSCRGVEGFGGNSGFPICYWQDPAVRCGAGSASGLFMGGDLRLGQVRSPCSATHTLTSSSSSASANSKVFACTMRGTGALLPAWGAPHSSSRLSQEARAWGSTSTSSRRASTSV